MNKRDNIIKWMIISVFVGLYVMTSVVSTIHVIDFFRLSNPEWLAVTLAIAFEVGAAASLAAIIILDRTSRGLVWLLFVLITAMQIMGNMYYAYTHLGDYRSWSELFGLIEEEEIFQKRILAIVSGAILPILALGFIKSLVDYIRPTTIEDVKEEFKKKHDIEEEIERQEIEEKISDLEHYKEEQKIEEELESEIEKEVVQDFIESSNEITNIENKKEIESIEFDKSISDGERTKKLDRKIKQIISDNPELKEKISEKLKEIEDGDKYNKTEGSKKESKSSVTRRTYGGM